MKKAFAVGHRLPFVNIPLFGDRKRFGLESDYDDPMWDEWNDVCSDFYTATQRSGIGKRINNSGFNILKNFDFTDKTIVEIGPGYCPHLPFLKTKPAHYVLLDIREEYLENAANKLAQMGISHETHLVNASKPHLLPLRANVADVVLTFYSLEHLYPLQNFVSEYLRILRGDGHIVGAIPAEGGLAWGMGRCLTSRRWIKRNTTINPDKLICWEHPNLADHIINVLGASFKFDNLSYWPLRLPIIDVNLTISFIAKVKHRA